jgi:RNA polymerase sigma-70 factor, ECF subfamily
MGPRSADGHSRFKSDPRDGEEALVQGLKAGEEACLGGLMGMHWEGLLRFARSILDDRDRAEDVVQEAFVRLWLKRSTLEREDTVRPILYRIVRNRALNERRRQRTFARWARRNPRPEADPTPGPLRQAEAGDLQAIVEDAVHSLPERRREIFVLVRFHQMSYRDVGEALEISTQTVANQMTKAMADLRTALEAHLPPRDAGSLPLRRA